MNYLISGLNKGEKHYKSSTIMRRYIDATQKLICKVQDIIDREEHTPHSHTMDFTLSSLAFLHSLQRLLEFYEDQDRIRGIRYNAKWTEEENNLLREFLPMLSGNSGRQSHIIAQIAQRMGRTFEGVRHQLKEITHH